MGLFSTKIPKPNYLSVDFGKRTFSRSVFYEYFYQEHIFNLSFGFAGKTVHVYAFIIFRNSALISRLISR